MTKEPDLLAAADQNLVALWRTVLHLAPAPGVVDHGEIVTLSSGLPVPLFNPTFVTGPTADPTAAVERIVAHYTSLDAPFVVTFRDDVAPGVAEACAATGLIEHWQPPLMVLAPVPAPPEGPPELRVEAVTPATLAGSAEVLERAFGIPPGLIGLLSDPRLLDLPGFSVLLGTIDGQPVGTAAAFATGSMIGVYNVATVPEARGQGVGAALTWAAVGVGHAAGADHAILQASQQGEPVYLRMGFRTPARYRQFEPSG